MEAWSFIQEKLETACNVILLWVLHSEGSSPGRKGFKMVVASDGSFDGTIGGGMMEHKLVEKAKSLLHENASGILLQKQYHDKEHQKDQSGMICSGSQLIAFVPLSSYHLSIIKNINSKKNDRKVIIWLTKEGLSLTNIQENSTGLIHEGEEQWKYSERLDQRPIIHIVGGGHVSLALSELMNFLGFYIKVYDNRPELQTMHHNHFAHEKYIADYEQIASVISDDTDAYLVIMTFGYRDDKTVFRQLMKKRFFYSGMMGSENKIQQLVKELSDEGFNAEDWQHWFMPIGINIHSKTTKEIAVSIAAEIIREKNKHLASNRIKQEA